MLMMMHCHRLSVADVHVAAILLAIHPCQPGDAIPLQLCMQASEVLSVPGNVACTPVGYDVCVSFD